MSWGKEISGSPLSHHGMAGSEAFYGGWAPLFFLRFFSIRELRDALPRNRFGEKYSC